MRFHAVLQLHGKTATGISVPAEVVERLGSGKRPAVRVTFNDFTYRTTVAPMGGEFLVPVSAQIRESAGVTAGDALDIEIELDTEPREIPMPPDLAEALVGEAEAARTFDGLSVSNKKRIIFPIEEAKTPETRKRRIEKAVATLRDGRV